MRSYCCGSEGVEGGAEGEVAPLAAEALDLVSFFGEAFGDGGADRSLCRL